jgi:hypothetical protein
MAMTELIEGAQPAGVPEALAVVAGFDEGLVNGFGRIGEERAAALAALAGAVAATPLGDRVAEAADKLAAGAVSEDYLLALAAARAALLGAVHDALLAGADAALGRTRGDAPAVPREKTTPRGPQNACRSWLAEAAIAGWRGVDDDLVSAAGQALDALLAEPTTRRLAVLVDGLVGELRASTPVATMSRVPVRRWGDMWMRAMLLTQGAGPAPAVTEVDGRLLPLGVELREHGTAVQLRVHGILEADGERRLVRASVAAAKVDTIVGTAVWKLFDGVPNLGKALAEHRGLDLTGMPLRDTGDLVWNDELAKPGGEADPFAVARVQLGQAVAAPVAPLDRHPVAIAEPMLWEAGGPPVPLLRDRLPASGPLTAELVAGATACIGLLCWDAGSWTLQPLAVQATVKKKAFEVHTADWALGPTDPKVVKGAAKSGDPVGVLRERAGRLLRR